MLKASVRGGLAAAVVVALASCTTPEPPPPPPPPQVPDLVLNEGVAQAAAVYVAFIRDVSSIQAGFPDAASVQAALRKGAAYEPNQLSRGMIAYGAILALQEPEFVAGLRAYAADPSARRIMIDRIIAEPTAVSTLAGADKAAGLIIDTLGKDSTTMANIAEAVEGDAYTIQERTDPRRSWAITPVPNRPERIQAVKDLSATALLPSPEESARLFAAAHTPGGLGVAGNAARGPYTPAVSRSLAIAALAALGAGGDDYRRNTDALSAEPTTEFCLNMSKLMLYQCMAASRPSYEDMFCVGRHIARDLATCTAQSLTPGPLSIPSAPAVEPGGVVTTPEQSTTPAPAQTPAPTAP